MYLNSTVLRGSVNFSDSLNRIERANGTDKSVTSIRNYEDMVATLNACVDVARFNKNVSSDLYSYSSDGDQVELRHALDNVHLCNSLRSARTAVATLETQATTSFNTCGSLETYKTSRRHYYNQRSRNKTVAKHVYNMILHECGNSSIVHNSNYVASYSDDVAFLSDGSRFYIIFGLDTPGKDNRRELKQAGFIASTTSQIMYCDIEGHNFTQLVTLALNAMRGQNATSIRVTQRRNRRYAATCAALA